MTKFDETQEAADFIASADSRGTSREIMEAIAFFARDLGEAESLWNGDGFGVVCLPLDIWEHVTGNGRTRVADYHWGAAGSNWWETINDCWAEAGNARAEG